MFKKFLDQCRDGLSKTTDTIKRGFENSREVISKAFNNTPSATEESPEVESPQPAPQDHQENIDKTPRQYKSHPSEHYMDLKIRFRDIGRLSAISETIGRDYLTAMPEGAAKRRLGQIAYLYRRLHEDLICGDVAEDIEKAKEHRQENPKSWDEWDSANLDQMSRIYIHKRHIPADLEEDRARLSYNCRRVHRECLANNDWKTARSFLKDVTDMHIRLAEARARGTNTNSAYQALMSEYIPGNNAIMIDEWFGELEKGLTGLLPKVMEKQKTEPEPIPLQGPYPAESQMWLNKCLVKVIGFDFDRGGLYETGHNPVEGGTPEDTRLVIKNVDVSNFLDSMKSALHEGGHGIYIQGLPRDTWRYQPVAQDVGAAVHESQALLIEMMIGRTQAFFSYISPRLEGLYHRLHDKALSPENLYLLRTRVGPTADRKKADEITYFFHILLRYRLESRLIDGDLDVDDIPDYWNAELQDLLGVLPSDNTDGCLQDVHWFVGKFGYFPSYTLGHMMAAQLFQKLQVIFPDLRQKISNGDLLEVTQWLKTNIYQKGRTIPDDKLFREITGKPLGTGDLLKHLENRYLHTVVKSNNKNTE